MSRQPMGRAVRDAVRLDSRLLPAGTPLAGRVLRRLSRRVEVFCRIDAYGRYDAAHVAIDDRITERDLEGANVVAAGITKTAWREILDRDPLEDLASVPRDADLLKTSDAEWARDMRPAVARLLARLAEIPNVESPRATKVLYLKRPALIPPFDAVLLGALTGSSSHDAATGLRALDALRHVGLCHAKALDLARAFLHARGFTVLTRLRILESALSMEASGKYDPLWEALGWGSWTLPQVPELSLFDPL